MHEVELGPLEHLLQGAGHVQGEGDRPPAPERQALAHRHQAGAALLGEHGLRIVLGRLDLGPALPHQLAGVRGGDDDHPVPEHAELVREALNEADHLVMLLPGVGRHLGDGEALPSHGLSIRAYARQA